VPMLCMCVCVCVCVLCEVDLKVCLPYELSYSEIRLDTMFSYFNCNCYVYL